MARETNKINLFPHLFLQHEIEFLSAANMKALVFRYPSGVCAVRIINKRGEVVVLPFHGQQVWDAQFDGRRIKMETAVKEPKESQDFLSNMGGFLFHCGMGAMGSPGPDDDHPIHGELVNAKYQHAYLETGSDENGSFISHLSAPSSSVQTPFAKHKVPDGPPLTAKPTRIFSSVISCRASGTSAQSFGIDPRIALRLINASVLVSFIVMSIPFNVELKFVSVASFKVYL